MKRLLAAAFVSLLAVGQVHADWDPELEAQEQREREAAAREQAAREAAAQKIIKDAEAKAHAAQMVEKRKYVGAAAQGTLHQHDRDRSKTDSGYNCLDGGEGEPEIGCSRDTQGGERNEDVDQSLHAPCAPNISNGLTLSP